MERFDYDSYTDCVKFKTAVTRLSNKVQEEDGKVFFISDVLGNYEDGLRKFEELKQANPNKSYVELMKLSKQRTTNSDGSYSETEIYPGYYHLYWKLPDGTFYRICIECVDEGRWYIDCGYSYSFLEAEKIEEHIEAVLENNAVPLEEIKLEEYVKEGQIYLEKLFSIEFPKNRIVGSNTIFYIEPVESVAYL